MDCMVHSPRQVASKESGLTDAPESVPRIHRAQSLDLGTCSHSTTHSLRSPHGRSGRQKERIREAVEDGHEEGSHSEGYLDSSGEHGTLLTRFGIDDATKLFLAESLKGHFLFGTMPEKEHEEIISHMKGCAVQPAQFVFKQGDVGDKCYFIKMGVFEVSIDGETLKELTIGDTFGELALLYQTRRTASVRCNSTDGGELWQMDNSNFRRCMENLSSRKEEKTLAFFRTDKNFSHLKPDDMHRLAKACTEQHFSDGEWILRGGEVGKWMFVVTSGKVAHSDEVQHEEEEGLDGAGSILGLVGVMYDKRQALGGKAVGDVTCLAMGKGSLESLPGAVIDLFQHCAFKHLLKSIPSSAQTFKLLTDDQLNRMIATAEDAYFESAEVIFMPGDQAQFILVVDGEVAIVSDVTVERRDGGFFCSSEHEARNNAERMLIAGMGFGDDLELPEGFAISRYAVAVGPARVHRITHEAVLERLGQTMGEMARQNEVKRVLSDIFLFKNLREEQIERVVRQLEQRTFGAGEIVVTQDDVARHFYLIQSGTICVRKGDATLRTLGRWDYFGERGLLLHERRSATCQAVEESTCLVLDADVFFEIVGMFRKELERRMYLQDLNITMADLRVKAIVGRGAFGTVRLVYHKDDQQKVYALKGVKKHQVVKNNQEKSIVMEREVNAQCYHPCIVQFIKTFQDASYVYFLTEFLGGGDLFLAIRQIGFLSKPQAQFFAGSITLGIEYLHARGIMYRDLKPENVLLDFEGQAKLVDFGCCKKGLRTTTLVGTPEYLAPEVIIGAGYTCSVDWWSMGVMMHEFIVGPLPFGADTEDQMKLFREILENEVVFPNYITDEDAIAVLSALLCRKPEKRLGGGPREAKEIKEHAYFAGANFGWDALAGGFLEAPWKPDVEALQKEWEPAKADDLQRDSKPLKSKTIKGMEWAKVF